tara:strand:+ start:13501 stop:14043 length:543 start_codon:yes stop_codon:yes gene_type:complete
MESLEWLQINKKEKWAAFTTVDALAILPLLRNRDFKILEMIGIKDQKEQSLLWENEERQWVKEEHYLSILSIIEEDECYPIHYMSIELDNNDLIKFSYGELFIKLTSITLMKKITLKILENYGYFIADKIWNHASNPCNQDYAMPIYFVRGMEERDINDEINELTTEANRITKERQLLDK